MNISSVSCTSSRTGALHPTQKVDYALFLLSNIAKDSSVQPSSIRALAKQHQLSFAFLQKVAGLLKKGGIITGVRGKTGGYYLRRESYTISLKDVIEAVDGSSFRPVCFSEKKKKPVCHRGKLCSIRSGLHRIQEEMKQVYFKKTIQDIIGE